MTPVEASDRRRSFCARLKSERERKGTSLAAIAATTKIKASLLDALERGDLSHWPKGIYRRAFFREYVAAIGLPVDPMANDFTDLFTDQPIRTPADAADPDPDALRLFFGPEQTGTAAVRTRQDVKARAIGAGVELVVLLSVAKLVSAVAPVGTVPVALALVALCYLATCSFGVSPALWLWAYARSRRSTAPAEPLVVSFDPAKTTASPLFDRLVGTIEIGRTLLMDYAERISASELTAGRRRQRDLASLRRQRVESAERTTADEVVV